MGALETALGKVGTGFTDAERDRIDESYIGRMIEVGCWELTEDAKFKQPRFLRFRDDL